MIKNLLSRITPAVVGAVMLLAAPWGIVVAQGEAEMMKAFAGLSAEERAELMRRFQEQAGEEDDADATSDTDPEADAKAGDSSRDPRSRAARDVLSRDGRKRDALGADEELSAEERDALLDEMDAVRDGQPRRKRKKELREEEEEKIFDLKACLERRALERFVLQEEESKAKSTLKQKGDDADEKRLAREDALACSQEKREYDLIHTDPFGRFLDRPEPFGYDLFDQEADSFKPGTDIPVPTDYVLGPGDKVEVQLFGKENRRLVLTVTRDGILQFPQLGPIGVAGMSFDDVRAMLEAQVAESMIGVQASVTMGKLRSIRVFVLGDVRYPGSYTVSSLSTVTNALFVGGGIRETGSLRNVQLKRAGRVVTTLDLYDLLLNGDTSRDTRLQPGDVVFVGPVGKTVSISGEVVRPATYELTGPTTIDELIKLGGGLLPTAYVQKVALERIRGQSDRTVATLDLSRPAGGRATVQSGDHLRVYSVFDRAENVVLLTGAFARPSLVEWHEGMRLTDAIPDLRQLQPRADRDYLLIRREIGPERRVEMLSANLAAALADPSSAANVELQSRDQLVAFPGEGSREELLAPLIKQLEQQAGIQHEAQIAEVTGRVKAPGVYPLTAQMTVTDLLRAAGGGTDDAYPREVEITRRVVVDSQRREITRIVVNLTDPVAAQTPLWPYDTVNVRPIEGWNETEIVTLSGEVKLPGEYVIQPNETMESVIRRAGGFTEQAYLPGAVFSREEIRKRQQEELQRQARRLRAELLQVQLDYRGPDKQDIDANRVRQLGALLSEELTDAEALGRVVVDMEAAASGQKPVILRGGDTVNIPRQPSEVTVLGEVSYPTTHLFQERYSYKDYMRMSGGFNARADKGAAFVVRINGEVVALDRAEEAMPGDVIIVPFKVDRGRGLFITATIAQIIGQLAITAASFKTVGVF